MYGRVSIKDKQDPQGQLHALEQWATNQDQYEVSGIFIDEMSSRDRRPQKEAVLKLLRTGQAQGVAFTELSRWGRNMVELVLELEEFGKSGVILLSLREGLDLSTAAGRFSAHILAALCDFERGRLSERTISGMQYKKSLGKHIGRPKKQK